MSELSRAVEAETAAFAPDHVPPFGVVLARKRARTRQVRAAAGAVLAVSVAAAGAVAVPSLVGSPQERLLPPAAAPSSGGSAAAAPAGEPPLSALLATAQAEVVAADGRPRLAVRVSGRPVPLGTGISASDGLQLTFSSLTDEAESFAPYPHWSAEAGAAGGPGVLGLGGLCGRGWDQAGEPRTADPCSAALVASRAQPGSPARAPLVLHPRIGAGRALPGTYRAAVELGEGQTLRITVQVTE